MKELSHVISESLLNKDVSKISQDTILNILKQDFHVTQNPKSPPPEMKMVSWDAGLEISILGDISEVYYYPTFDPSQELKYPEILIKSPKVSLIIHICDSLNCRNPLTIHNANPSGYIVLGIPHSGSAKSLVFKNIKLLADGITIYNSLSPSSRIIIGSPDFSADFLKIMEEAREVLFHPEIFSNIFTEKLNLNLKSSKTGNDSDSYVQKIFNLPESPCPAIKDFIALFLGHRDDEKDISNPKDMPKILNLLISKIKNFAWIRNNKNSIKRVDLLFRDQKMDYCISIARNYHHYRVHRFNSYKGWNAEIDINVPL